MTVFLPAGLLAIKLAKSLLQLRVKNKKYKTIEEDKTEKQTSNSG